MSLRDGDNRLGCRQTVVNNGFEGLEPATFGATIRRLPFPGVAAGCRIGLDKPISLLAVACCFCVLRARWCQSGVNIILSAAARVSSRSPWVLDPSCHLDRPRARGRVSHPRKGVHPGLEDPSRSLSNPRWSLGASTRPRVRSRGCRAARPARHSVVGVGRRRARRTVRLRPHVERA
jgi:hypothetical protein